MKGSRFELSSSTFSKPPGGGGASTPGGGGASTGEEEGVSGPSGVSPLACTAEDPPAQRELFSVGCHEMNMLGDVVLQFRPL